MSRTKGCLAVFMGIDGSGKSSVIEYIENSSPLADKYAITSLYLGNRDFLIPGLNNLYVRYSKNKSGLTARVIKIICVLDQKLRAIKIIIKKRNGSLILCDRFYYDNQVSMNLNTTTSIKFIDGIIRKLINWSPVKPDVVFLLDVDAETAHIRKGQHNINLLRKNAQGLKALLSKQEGLFVINANENSETVNQQISNILHTTMERLNDDPAAL